MQKKLWKKGLAVAVICLFIIISYVPSILGDLQEHENAKPIGIGQDLAIIDIDAWHFYRETQLQGIAFDAIVKNVGTEPYHKVRCSFYGTISKIPFPRIISKFWSSISGGELQVGETFNQWSAFAVFGIFKWWPFLYNVTVEMRPDVIDTNEKNNQYSEIFFIWGGIIFYDFGE